MAQKPGAQWPIDESIVRDLLRSAGLTNLQDLPLAHVADGWDCSVWRLGDRLAVRVPRRELALPLVRHEQQQLPAIAERLAPTGIRIPSPVVSGMPTDAFPAPWSVVPWFDGEPGLRVPRAERGGWAAPLALALRALHVPAVGAYPRNPVRGRPLATRGDAVAERIATLRSGGTVAGPRLDRLAALWQAALDAAEWDAAPVWIHGDLHPGNVIARGDELVALIDFGDITAGDPAYDLAIAWLAFDDDARAVFRGELGDAYDDAPWVRARGWAAADAILFLLHTDDDPEYAGLAVELLDELAPRTDNA